MTKKCVLLTTADEKNIKYTSYTIYTLYKHSPNVIPYVGILNLDNKIIDAKQLLKSNPNALIFDLNDIFKKTIANIEYQNFFHKIVLLKLFIPSMPFFKEDDYVLYLDNDIQINGNIEHLFDMDSIQNYDVVGFEDICKDDLNQRIDNLSQKFIKTNPNFIYHNSSYVNGGCLFINCKNLQNYDMKDIINNYDISNFDYSEQDFINGFFNVKCIIDENYNSCKENAVIKHYMSPCLKAFYEKEIDEQQQVAMFNNLTDIFNYSFAMTIDDARYKLFQQNFSKNNLPCPQKFDGLTVSKYTGYWKNQFNGNEHNALILSICASHQAIIRLAKNLNFPYVVIFEDDAYPCKNISEQLVKSLNELPSDADCAILGYYENFVKSEAVNKYWIKHLECNPDAFAGAHAYIIFRKAYDKLIDICKNIDAMCDHSFLYLDNVYLTVLPLFIQYNETGATNNSSGFHYPSDDKIFNNFCL